MISFAGLGEARGVGERSGVGDSDGVGDVPGVGDGLAAASDGVTAGEFEAVWFCMAHPAITKIRPANSAP